MNRFDFPAGVQRQAALVADRCFGVGIGNASEHGLVLVDGYQIGPGSPLVFGEGGAVNCRLDFPSFYRGNAQLLVAECPEELAVLCRPRPPYYQRFSGTTTAETDFNISIPFSGRARFYGSLLYTGAGTPIGGPATKMRHWWGTGDTDFDTDTLNTYTAASFVEDVATGFEETERGDELVIRLNFDVGCTFRLSVWAHDEGT